MYLHEEEFRACFLLAGLRYANVYPIENEYCGSVGCCPEKRWFLFKTDYGLIKIGWRKRVINIDWKDTGYTANNFMEPTENWITHGENFVHAYGYNQCVKFLDRLAHLLEKHQKMHVNGDTSTYMDL